MKKIILITTLALILAGCGDPKQASEKNFEVAIQQYLDKSYPACVIRDRFPSDPFALDIFHHEPIYVEMEKMGLLTKKEEMKKQFSYGKATLVTSYDLSAEGKKYYIAPDEKTRDIRYGFCFGKAKVEKIIDFSEPSEMMGNKISRVNYTYKVTDLPDWLKKPEITKLNEQIKNMAESTETPIKADGTMMLTNKGWVESHLFGEEK
jgi:Prokaryotic membrane lipoprotein lipid attachment site